MPTPAEILKQFNDTMDSYIAAEEGYRSAMINPVLKEKADTKIQCARYAKRVLKNICEKR